MKTNIVELNFEIERLTSELRKAREKLSDYKNRTRFVRNDLKEYRKLVRSGVAAHLPACVANEFSANPVYAVQIEERPDVWAIKVPERTLYFGKKRCDECNNGCVF